MTSDYPKVSAIVTTHNRAKLLPRALASVLEQADTFDDFEVIVVDDASTDDTATVIREWSDKFWDRGVRFTALRMGENSGYYTGPSNIAITHARGDFLRFLDDDNEWTAGSLKALYDAIVSGDRWDDLVYGRLRYVRDEGAPEKSNGGVVLPEGPAVFTEFDRDRLAAGPTFNFIDRGDFIISRGAFWWIYEHTGMMWNAGYRRFGDWEFLCRAANLDRLVAGVAPLRMRGIDSIVSVYHWTGSNLQLTRPAVETPRPRSARTGEMLEA